MYRGNTKNCPINQPFVLRISRPTLLLDEESVRYRNKC